MAKKSVNTQMELFEDGGLKDQGNTKDPVSGNNVPVGSTKEEVRDDIPAQLSEGEFVLPADVVRYHGLEKIMGIRDQAKEGLQKMEAMGQMGNSDQATIPDGVPFTGMAEGGAVPGLNIQKAQPQKTRPSMFQPPKVVQPPVVTPPVVGVPTRPVYASSKQTPQQPYTFQQAIGTPFGQQQQSETRVFVNDAGEKLYIPFVNGQPVYPIPAGYKQEEVAEKEKEQEQTVTDVRSRTTTDSGSDDVGIESTPVADIAREAQQREKGISKGLIQGIGALVNPIATIGGTIISNIMDRDKPETLTPAEALDEERAFEGITPQEVLEENSKRAFGTDITNATAMFGATPTFKFGTGAGDVDSKSNGVYHASGLAMNADGSAALTDKGTVSYKSWDDFINHLSASHDTGWHGSTISKDEYYGTGAFQGKGLSKSAQEKYSAWADKLGYSTTGGTTFADPKDDRLTKKGDEIKGGDQKPKTTISKPFGKDEDRFRGDFKPMGYVEPFDDVSPDTKQTKTTDPRAVDPTEFAKGAPKSAGDFRIGRDPKLAAGVTTKGDRSKPMTIESVFKQSPAYISLVRAGLAGTDLEQAEQKQKDQRAKVEADIKSGKADTSIPTYTSPTYSYDYYDSGDGSSDSGADASDPGSSDMGFSTASGGFIQRKNLPKANKKKQGGLASRR
jgi:hypothetical protein